MPEDDNKGVIRIESILGGHAPMTHFAGANQFKASLGIDPSGTLDDTDSSVYAVIPSGLLRPRGVGNIQSGVIHNIPLWLESNPKNGNVFVYDSAGSVYTIDANFTAITALGDLNDDMTSTGNGCAYYDNYIYFATNTTVARYGPLDGTAAFTDNYWVSTLSKTRLTDNSNYPLANQVGNGSSLKYPNHVLHRHSDGKLYIADVVDGKGTIHYIATTKSSVEGDTDNGSTYNKVQVGYGLLPTAMESYGSDLAIAFYEGSGSYISQSRAKIAFWDTTSTNINKITWVEFPDPYISSMKNINGVLYVASGRVGSGGFRILRFVGGYTFEEVHMNMTAAMPFPDGMDGQGDQLLFASFTDIPETAGCVFSLGLQNNLSKGVFNIHRVSSSESSAVATCLHLSDNHGLNSIAPTVGWGTGDNGTTHNSVDTKSSGYSSNFPSVWWSQMYRIGQPAKITKIRIPLAQVLTSSMTIVPKIYYDSGAGTETLTTINSTNFGTNTQSIVLRPTNLTVDNDFWLELRWTGSALCTVALPITIEYELLDVDTAYP